MFSMFITMLKVYDLFESGKLIYCMDMLHPEYLSLLMNQRPFRNDIKHVVPMIFRQTEPQSGHRFPWSVYSELRNIKEYVFLF